VKKWWRAVRLCVSRRCRADVLQVRIVMRIPCQPSRWPVVVCNDTEFTYIRRGAPG